MIAQEDKELLLKDLCARLPYGVKANIPLIEGDKRIYTISFSEMDDLKKGHITIIPYLRPMSSMTEEEKNDYLNTFKKSIIGTDEEDGRVWTVGSIDWLNRHHFDYRGLIPMGLALEAPEGMYNIIK